MKKWKQLLVVFAVTLGLGVAFVPAPQAAAINVFEQCDKNKDAAVCKAQGEDDATSMAEIVINTMLLVLGMIAVIMIIIGGVRYTMSGGDSSLVKAAKETILYSVVGLVVAILAFAIVNFVVNRFI